MWYWIIGFICFFVGGTIGIFAMALLNTAKGNDYSYRDRDVRLSIDMSRVAVNKENEENET